MQDLKPLSEFVGRQINRIRRVFFTVGAETDRRAGPMELTFTPGGTLLLDVGADGEALVVREEPWHDPFESPISTENQAWIAEHGQWTALDVSREPAYERFIGATLRSIHTMRTAAGTVCGLRLMFDTETIDFVGSADEALVFLSSQDDLRLAAMKVSLGEKIQ
jgi:hypothetical protein